MALERKTSVGVGLATMAAVWVIYQNKLAPMVDVRANGNNDPDVSASEKTARWTSAIVVGGVSLLSQDMTVFIMGATAIILESWAHRHANSYDPAQGGVVIPPKRSSVFAGVKLSASADAGY
jgi:hypothetical protein